MSFEEAEEIVCREGADILFSEEMKRTERLIQHGSTSVFEHCRNVACQSLIIADYFHCAVDERAMVRGALLHDYFLYDWHTPNEGHSLHGFRHAKIALRNAERDFQLGRVERDVIRKHMFPLNITPPRYRESLIVSLADKICAVGEMRAEREARKRVKITHF